MILNANLILVKYELYLYVTERLTEILTIISVLK